MRMHSILVLAAIVFWVVTPAWGDLADPIFIVDTGQPLVTGPPSSGGWVLNMNQSLAVEFTLEQAYTLSDIEGFIGGEVAGTATITIYNDAGEVPGSEVFSSGVSLELVDAWQGLSGRSWNMEAGSYWLSFELRAGDTFTGRMLSDSPSPLGNEAYTTHGYIPLDLQGGSWWVPYDGLNIGVRIQGTPEVVPVPGAVLLGSIGLGLSGWLCRRRET